MLRYSLALVTLFAVGQAHAAVADAEHHIVFSDPDLFAGWPANEGFWQWGDEMLVGFNVTAYEETASGHNTVPGAYQWVNFARSLDGGETWSIEQHPEVSIPGFFNGPNYVKSPSYPAIPSAVPSPGGFDFTSPGFALKARNGIFQVSDDKGQTWSDPYSLPDFGQAYVRSRTNYLTIDSQTMVLFIEATDYPPSSGEYMNTMVVQTTDGGQTFQQLSWLSDDPLQGNPLSALPAYALMPGVAKLDDGTLLAGVRNRLSGQHWNDFRASTDGGSTWDTISTPVVGNNNPVSIIPLGGQRLGMVYGARLNPEGLRGKISEDGGQTWSQEYILRDDGREWDLGYVRAGLRDDGNITAVYYYTTAGDPAQHIASTIWDVPKTSQDAIGTWYKFDETSGPVVNDSIGTAHGTATDVTFGPSGVSGEHGNAGHFNGTTSEVTFDESGHPEAFDLGTDNFTIAGWVKAPTNTETGVYGNRPIFQNIDYSGGGWAFELGRADRSYAGEVFFTVGGGNSSSFGQTQVFSDTRIDDDQWHWVAVVNNGGEITMYIDGELQQDDGEMQPASTATAPPSVVAQMGMRGISQKPFEGSLDDWQIFNTALTSAIDGNGMLIGGGLFEAWQGLSLELLEGDLNGDGFVGVDDLNIVLVNWNQNVPPGDLGMGDATGEGFVGVDDLNAVLVNWNNGTPPAEGTAIPEPASLHVLLGLSAAVLAGRRRRVG